MKEAEKEYTPFGEQWEKEISRLSKYRIIKFLRDALFKNIVLEKRILALEDSAITGIYKKSLEN